MAALVIGNADYPDGSDLKNPVNDTTDLGAKRNICPTSSAAASL
jgi:hypothetical protein